MTTAEMNVEILKTYTGRIMRDTRYATFKIVVCLAPAPRAEAKLRVCVWSESQGKWAKPTTRSAGELEEIVLAKITPAQRRTCQHACNHIIKNDNTVIPGKPADPSKPTSHHTYIYVGRPWLTKADPHSGRRVAVENVTQLTGTAFTATGAKKSTVQKLNNALSDWMFGGGKR